MTGRKRGTLVVMVLLVLLIVLSGWSVYGAWRQTQRNAGLIAAIKREDVTTVETLLEKGADPNTTNDTDGRVPWRRLLDFLLHKTPAGGGTPALEMVLEAYRYWDSAACKQSDAMLLALIKHGANPNVKDGEGDTPLLLACAGDDQPLVRVALAHGAKVNTQNRSGVTPLMRAAHCGDAELVRILLSHGALVNIKDRFGGTALLRALGEFPHLPFVPFPAVVKMLVANGADVNAKDVRGLAPLKLAVWLKRPDLIRL